MYNTEFTRTYLKRKTDVLLGPFNNHSLFCALVVLEVDIFAMLCVISHISTYRYRISIDNRFNIQNIQSNRLSTLLMFQFYTYLHTVKFRVFNNFLFCRKKKYLLFDSLKFNIL